jgi:hypothetical protein
MSGPKDGDKAQDKLGPKIKPETKPLNTEGWRPYKPGIEINNYGQLRTVAPKD